jgi:transposase
MGFTGGLRKNWLFAGSLRSGQRAAAIMSLLQSAKINGLDPYANLKIIQKNFIRQLLSGNWVGLRF